MRQFDEPSLLAQVALGDQEALKLLYEIYRPRIWSYLSHQLGRDAQCTEEVLQDIFVAVWRNAGTFRGTAKVGTWIFRITHNHALNALAAAARQPTTLAIEDDEGDEGRLVRYVEPLDTQIIDRLVLVNALRQLSEKHRAVLDLVCYQGFSVEESAQIIGVPEGTIKSRLSYARRALESALAQSHWGEEVGYGA